MKRILIISGEPSGDLHAANLVISLKRLDPGLIFYGLGGEKSKAAGVDVIFDISRLALVGYLEVIKNLFVVGQAFHAIMSKVDRDRPDLAILVDYPGFNLRIARQMKERGIPVVYYISPQVWAWGADRIDIIKECVRKIIVFFKFEEDLYRSHHIDAECVGHPLIETVAMTLSKEEAACKFGIGQGKTAIAILPGSRNMEVRRLLPVMARAALAIVNGGINAQFLVAKHPNLPLSLYQNILKKIPIDLKIVDGDTYNLVGACDFAIVASGTATLETAIIGTPFVIIYKTDPLTYMMAMRVMKTKFLGLVNILAAKEIVPEFLQKNATPEKISASVLELLNNPDMQNAVRREFSAIKASLGSPGASSRAAAAIRNILGRSSL